MEPGKRPELPRREVVNLCESEGLVERSLRRFIVGKEHLLPDIGVWLKHGVDEPRPHPGTSVVWMNEDVLEVDDAHSVTDHSSQPDERLIIPGGGDPKRLTQRQHQSVWLRGVGRPPNRGIQRNEFRTCGDAVEPELSHTTILPSVA